MNPQASTLATLWSMQEGLVATLPLEMLHAIIDHLGFNPVRTWSEREQPSERMPTIRLKYKDRDVRGRVVDQHWSVATAYHIGSRLHMVFEHKRYVQWGFYSTAQCKTESSLYLCPFTKILAVPTKAEQMLTRGSPANCPVMGTKARCLVDVSDEAKARFHAWRDNQYRIRRLQPF